MFVPSFDEQFSFLNQFIHELANDYRTGAIKSWNELDEKVKAFFTPEMLDQMEAMIPHWHKMAAYVNGVTLTHVMCVFMGMYMMPEFLSMTEQQQQTMKWTILLHDIEKEPQEHKRDYPHAFRSAVSTARTLPKFGFPVTDEYNSVVDDWSAFTFSAITRIADSPNDVQDNVKLPEILNGIERLFGQGTPASLITKTVLLHLSIDMNAWPPPNPLTDAEIQKYVSRDLMPLLKIMNLADNDGWAIFHRPAWERQRKDILEVFERISEMIA